MYAHGYGVRRRRFAVVLAGLMALLGVGLGLAPAASAHASLLFTTPTAGGSVPASPTVLTLIFDEPVGLSSQAVRLAGPGGVVEPLGAVVRDRAGSVVTAAVREGLTSGVYTVTWQVTAQDGDIVTGSYQFGVGPSAAGAVQAGGLGASGTSGQGATAALRWLLFAALSVALGEAAAIRLTRRHCPHGGAEVRPWMPLAAWVGVVAALGLAALIAGDGSLGSALTHPGLGRLSGQPGVLALLEAGAFAAAALPARLWKQWAWVPLVMVVVAEGLRGHPQAFLPGWGALATVAHVAAVAVWIGALVFVLRCVLAWRAVPGAGRAVLGAYARLAGWLFAAVVTSGVLSALIVVPLSELFSTSYGWLLVAKTVLVAVVAGCALTARARLRGGGLPTRWVRAEAGLLAAVLGVTAVLTASAPPRQSSAALPVAPPASGPVAPLGTRTGQLGVSVAASDGQVVVRLSAPGDDQTKGGDDAGFTLAGTLADPAGAVHRLTWRGCGTGCFVATGAWQFGTSHLTLRSSADHWRGGTASLALPWPATSSPQALLDATAELRAVDRFTLYEKVTSDTALGSGRTQVVALTGSKFLSAEPYGTGLAAIVDRVPGPDGTVTLLLGYPAENVQVALTLGADGRPVRETLTDPSHLITRTFVYPEKG